MGSRKRCQQVVSKTGIGRVQVGEISYSTVRYGGGGAEGQTRTVDTGIFSAVLYHLSYLGQLVYIRSTLLKLSRRWPGGGTNTPST